MKDICIVEIHFSDGYDYFCNVNDNPNTRSPLLCKIGPYVDERFFPQSTHVLNLYNLIEEHGDIVYFAIGYPDLSISEFPF